MTFSRTRCAHCRQKFESKRPGQIVHEECAADYVIALREKEERKAEKQARMQARVERAETRRKKEAMKTLPDLKKEAQIAFNEFIRLRDTGKPCICCGRPLGEGDVGGGYDCGHYRSVGSAPQHRYNELNAHAQRKQCNRWGAGRAVDYRIGLIARIGLEAVEALEANNGSRKWTADELRDIKAFYKAKTKQLKESRNG